MQEELGYESGQAAALEQLIAAEEARVLARAIALLPEAQQQVLTLRFVEGLGHEEIAGIVHKSQEACRVIQHRALTALNRILGGRRE